MYLVIGRYNSNTNNYPFVLLMFNSDGTFDENRGYLDLPDDLLNYQNELKQFKEVNNWNQPLY
jgi:hypothetical protein